MPKGLEAPQRCDLERIGKGTSMYRARKKTSFVLFYLPFQKATLGVIQDINNRVALSICKNMLNPSNVKNLSQNFKNIAI